MILNIEQNQTYFFPLKTLCCIEMKSFQVKTKSELILDSHSCVLFQLFVFVPKTRAFNPLPQSNMKIQ